MIELTNDADKMICYLYKEYLSRRKQGLSKANARYFSDGYSISDKVLSKWLPDDVFDVLMELKQGKYIKTYIDGSFEIQDNAIVYMENRFKNGINDITDFIAKFIP